ncbi:MAG: aminomethyl-transferring glycine dehydrogenase, partial [Rhodothermia bacterium]
MPLTDRFVDRHVGPDDVAIRQMLEVVGAGSLIDLVRETIPESIRMDGVLDIDAGMAESEVLAALTAIAQENRTFRSFIGMGYYDTIVPPVIQRNILESPGWYTQYTPYQAEIAQGRLEALLNFQTAVTELTGFEIANASLLAEGSAAAGGMTMFRAARRGDNEVFFVSENCHPQTIAVVETRAKRQEIKIVIGDESSFSFAGNVFGALLQYPTTDGLVVDYSEFCESAHANESYVAVATDLLALTLLRPPAEFGADCAVGNSQRFGVPLGYGGPHAAFFATKEEFKRRIPGRLIGIAVDSNGKPALRMALQTREQHIRREKATSNICTAQVLLAIMAGMYAVYHGAAGLWSIAERIHQLANILSEALGKEGHEIRHSVFFDTLRVSLSGITVDEVCHQSLMRGINLRYYENGDVGLSIDQATTEGDIADLIAIFNGGDEVPQSVVEELTEFANAERLTDFRRGRDFLTHQVFRNHQSETEMLRYLHKLESRDLSLNTSMIPLGSCTMKLNAAAQMMPVTLPGFGRIHPFAPTDQTRGYQYLFETLEKWLAEITGLPGVSLQPNSGAQGELAGLLVIAAYHDANGDSGRRACLIPSSAHGTNPASAVMAGMDVVIVKCDDGGNVDVTDLKAKAEAHADDLAALVITYPSTHGVFEPTIREICDIVHENGGQVYLDGANMNAQVGLCRPGDYGADVCHLNLHKTFAIPHGGGGPGVGPICVAEHLAPFLPGHPIVDVGGSQAIGSISAAPWGSAGVLMISWAYIALLGRDGLPTASEVAILNANYMAKRLEGHYDILYRGQNGRVAHEFIVDLRPIKREAGISAEDVAKRLIDYGFHAPTMSWPVPGTMMIEPTESESKAELDRFCDAMIAIRSEIQEVQLGIADAENNVLKNAPHTAAVLMSDDWDRPYSREKAAYPARWTRDFKFWPPVGRVDNAYGDRNL